MSGSAGGSGSDAGGGGGGGPDGAGGSTSSGFNNGSSGTDGNDVLAGPFTVNGGGSYGAGYCSITYPGTYGVVFAGGDSITIDPVTGAVTHVFYTPGMGTLTSVF